MRNTTIRLFIALTVVAICIGCEDIEGPSWEKHDSPLVRTTTPVDVQSGDVSIPYTLLSMEGNSYTITVSFSTDSGATFRVATQGAGGSSIDNRSSCPHPGVAHTFVWDSVADKVAQDTTINSCVIMVSAITKGGTPGKTDAFTVSNSGTAEPPSKVVKPSPATGTENASVTTILTWAIAPGATTYDIYFDTTAPPELVCSGLAAASYSPGLLSYQTTYYWRVDSVNATGNTTGDVWTFVTETEPTSLPDEVTGPTPADNETDVSVVISLSWNPSAGATGYYVCLDVLYPPPYVGNATSCSYDLETLDYSTVYYWEVVAYNQEGNTTATTWSFVTEDPSVQPPDAATNPTPFDGTGNVSITASLSWDVADRADGYYVHFGTTAPPPCIGESVAVSYELDSLSYGTTYYWRVVPYNTEGNASVVETWSFQTRCLQRYITNSIGMEFRLIPTGSFTMGDIVGGGDYWARPTHTVNITKDFYIGVHEVTQEQWVTVMGSNPSAFSGDNNPVESVSWDDVQGFVNALSTLEGADVYRLPTEAEWEYACRAGTTTKYCCGNAESTLSTHAWYKSNSGGKTHPIGKKLPNAWGLHDMHGNVWEWCEDWWGEYYYQHCVDNSIVDNPCGPGSGVYRVDRGGSFWWAASSCRSDRRGGYLPPDKSFDIGFRLCMIAE